MRLNIVVDNSGDNFQNSRIIYGEEYSKEIQLLLVMFL